jgi:hypothetical protein
VRAFEPALCSSSGVCRPDVDEAPLTFTADLAHLRERGADIARHNLSGEPLVFAHDPMARAFLASTGSEGLPLTSVNGAAVLAGRYPSRAAGARRVRYDTDPSPGARGRCAADDHRYGWMLRGTGCC